MVEKLGMMLPKIGLRELKCIILTQATPKVKLKLDWINVSRARRMLLKLLEEDFSPGGCYRGVWVRDSYFMLKYLLIEGRARLAKKLIEEVSLSQISESSRVIHGRGSSVLKYSWRVARRDLLALFRGAFPTSIHEDHLRVYGYMPDVDSTSYGILILAEAARIVKDSSLMSKIGERIESALTFLESRDLDGDSLPEQFENEDWADNLRRSGKVCYSLSTYLKALRRVCEVAERIRLSTRVEELVSKLREVESRIKATLWKGSHFIDYVDLSGRVVDRFSLDVFTYFTACESKVELIKQLKFAEKLRVRGKFVNIYPPMKNTAPVKLPKHFYQNSAAWPWIYSFLIEALINHELSEEAFKILEEIFPHLFHEWINPLTPIISGNYPFKTGASSIIENTLRIKWFPEGFTDSS